MNVYVAMPVVLKARAIAAKERWVDMGYRMAFFQDAGTDPFTDELTVVREYRGVYEAINRMSRAALQAGADVVLFAGDDMFPDPNHRADEIAAEYLDKFPDGYGVMQPCGDRQGCDDQGVPAARRICGSPWYGTGWINRAYGGRGPCWPDYHHFYGDEDLKIVAENLGVLWMREDLYQDHAHWSFGRMPRQFYHDRNQAYWAADKLLFEERKKEGFPS